MTDEPKTFVAHIIKFALDAGVVFAAKAEELGTTGKIRVLEGSYRNLEFAPGEWESLEYLALQKAEAKRQSAIQYHEAKLERLRKMTFEAPAKTEEVAE